MVDLRAVFDDLVRFETVLWNAIDGRLRRECDLGLGSFNVLLVIASTPSCRVQDVAHALEITVGGASQAVDRLEAQGHCTRRPNPTDRRSSILELTAAGQRLVAEARDVFDQELATHLGSSLSADALNHLGATLATLRAAGSGRGGRAAERRRGGQ